MLWVLYNGVLSSTSIDTGLVGWLGDLVNDCLYTACGLLGQEYNKPTEPKGKLGL